MKALVAVVAIALTASSAQAHRPAYRPGIGVVTLSRAELEEKGDALFEMVFSCVKSGAEKEACRAQLATALKRLR